ncbi:MAG: hypothetical protein AAGM67_09060, partial [Bacteroidota bacterium]
MNDMTQRLIHRYASSSKREPGEVWQTQKGNWRALDPKGDQPKTFKDKKDADAYAKGKFQRQIQREGIENYLKDDVEEVFKSIPESSSEKSVSKFFTVPEEIKDSWSEVSSDFKRSLKKGKVRKAVVEALGDTVKAAIKTFTSNKPTKELLRAVDSMAGVAGVMVVGENVGSLKKEFAQKVDILKKKYEADPNPDKDAYQKEYDKIKGNYENLFKRASGYSEAKNYRMMAQVVANAFLPKDDRFEMSDEERKTGKMYLVQTVLTTMLGGSNLVAGKLMSVLQPILSSSLGAMALGRVGSLVASALTFKIMHKGSQEVEKALGKGDKVNEYLEDFVVGYKTVQQLEKDLEELKDKADQKIEAIRKKGLSPEKEQEEIQKILDDLEDEEVKITEALAKGESTLSKYSYERVAAKHAKDSVGKMKEGFQGLLEKVVSEGVQQLEGITPEDLLEGMDEYMELAQSK